MRYVCGVAIGLMLLLMSGGCAMTGAALYKVTGPPDIPAKHELAKVPTLLLVENYRHQSSVNAQAETLARQLADDLQANKLGPIISLDEVQALRDAHPKEFPTMSMVELAKELGAKQIVYVQLHSADVSPLAGGTGYAGSATATVKVVDGTTGQTVWPIEQAEGYGVTAQTKMGGKHYPTAADVRNMLYADLTVQISQLFHKWKPEYEGQGVHDTEASK